MRFGRLSVRMAMLLGLGFGLATCQTDSGASRTTTGGPLISLQPVEVDGLYHQEASGMVFPTELGLLQRDLVIIYDHEEHHVSAGYALQTGETNAMAVSVYVYPNSGGAPVTETACADHFQNVKRQVSAIGFRAADESRVQIEKLGRRINGHLAEVTRDGQGLRAYLFCQDTSPWIVTLRMTYGIGLNPDSLIPPILEALPWPTKGGVGGTD